MSDSDQPHRYFFVHIQKTAGTALYRRLINHFGEAAVYPTRGVDGTDPLKLMLSIDHLRERLAARGAEIRVVTGHFPLCAWELLGGRVTTLTVLREPVERTLSFLRHHREISPTNRRKSLEEIYDDPLQFHALANNHMTKVLSLTPAEMTHGVLTRVEFTRERLERAKEGLAGVDAIGLQERFEDFCDELGARFGWRLGEPLSTNTSSAVEVSESFRARIAEDNSSDIELYEFANGLRATAEEHFSPDSAMPVRLDSRRPQMAAEAETDTYEADPGRWGHSLSNIAEVLLGCLDAIGARSVAEVGAYAGDLTRVLLDWAASADARVVAIDPTPQSRLVDLSERHPELELIQKPSHEALRDLPLPDAVIIDGDHNYYTVSEELRLIGDTAQAGELPLLMFHDVGWPHGRRDAYWAPDRIPEDGRQPLVSRAHLFPGEPGVVERGLPMYSSAEREGGPRNGILTAVEDFLGRREDLRLATLPPFFGFGVVWDRGARWADAVAEVVEPWDRNPMLERLEANRVYHLATSQSRAMEVMGAKVQLKKQREQSQARLQKLREENARLKQQREQSQARLQKLREENARLQRLRKKTQAELCGEAGLGVQRLGTKDSGTE